MMGARDGAATAVTVVINHSCKALTLYEERLPKKQCERHSSLLKPEQGT